MNDNMTHGGNEDAVSVLYSVLADRRCREVIEYFRSTGMPVASLDDLTEDVAPSEADDRTRMHLHHNTLPRLADAGILEYDSRHHDVRYLGHDVLESQID